MKDDQKGRANHGKSIRGEYRIVFLVGQMRRELAIFPTFSEFVFPGVFALTMRYEFTKTPTLSALTLV
jgi:hypothetical protein